MRGELDMSNRNKEAWAVNLVRVLAGMMCGEEPEEAEERWW